MHRDLISKFLTEKVSHEYYRKEVNKMNISFTKPRDEECKESLFCNEANQKCEMCEQWKHIESARIRRSHYKMDSENKSKEDIVYLAVDTQKVVMLPRILHSQNNW